MRFDFGREVNPLQNVEYDTLTLDRLSASRCKLCTTGKMRAAKRLARLKEPEKVST